jgi:hypothetical protein
MSAGQALQRRGGPLTDWRSLAVSIVLHLLIVFLAGLIVMQVAPETAQALLTGGRGLVGDLRPIDTRDGATNRVSGGSPGEAGGAGNIDLPRVKEGTSFLAPSADPGELILADALPAAKSSEAMPSDAGAEAADGPGFGFGTSFFGAEAKARSFAFIIDRSGSMSFQDALSVAKRELMEALRKLPPEARIAVVFYNQVPSRFTLSGSQNLVPATESNKAQVEKQLAVLIPEGGTDHMEALNIGMGMQPEVIFFLTDADLMTYSDVNKLIQRQLPVRIQTIHFSPGRDLPGATPLKRLAAATGGTYRHVDINQLGRDPRQ